MQLTARIAKELISHEAVVLEAYLDSVGVWTWGVGVTNASGHVVHPRYKDNPQTLERCLEIYIWLLQLKYMPTVEDVFAGHALTEAQFGAALSFHFNTGRLHTASWPRLWKAGRLAEAREAIMQWRTPASIIGRREKERDLFFDGTWSNDGRSNVIPVSKPSYQPRFSGTRRVDVSDILDRLIP